MKTTVETVVSLARQWELCAAANPKGDERCKRPKCKRCNRGRNWRQNQNRHH